MVTSTVENISNNDACHDQVIEKNQTGQMN